MEFVQLVAVFTLLARLLFHGGDCFNVLDIIVWSNGSSATSGSSVKGLGIDVVSGSNTTLQAVALKNVSRKVQLVLEWYKDDIYVGSSGKCRFTRNETTGGVQKAYCNLRILAVGGKNPSNYSVKIFNESNFFTNLLSVAYVVVTVGEALRPAFTVFPTEMTNCSSTSSSPRLSYAAVGFPKPVYTLRCPGMQYESQTSNSGEFLVPPDACCLGAQCVATVYNNYHEPVDSRPALVKELLPSSSCQRRISNLSSGLVILLQSRTRASFESDLNGQIIDIISNDVNATLEAFCYQYVAVLTQLELRWFKDGGTIDSLSMVPHVCIGSPERGSWMSCSLRLPLSSISGSLSGNYSIELRQANATDIMASAWVMVNVGEVQRPTFTVFPKPMINCSSANQSTILNYVAVGFPRPVYTLRCSGVQYESEPSASGQFSIPPEVCCLGSKCRASADNGYGDPVDSNWTIAKDLAVSASCQQHIDCLSPGMNIFRKSCASSTYDSVLNGKVIDVAADDLNATIEALFYQKSSTVTQLQLTWSKDGSTINMANSTPHQLCEGSEEWGSWTRCGFRLPLAALKGNVTGNYSVELRQANVSGIVASAWVVIITAGTQGLYNCSARDITQAYPYYVSSKFPNTCRALTTSSMPSPNPGLPMRIYFVRIPPPEINATLDFGNGKLNLTYAVGGQDSISANVSMAYTLHCSNSYGNVNGTPVSSRSGDFWASAPPCGSNTSCYATVNDGTGSSINSSVTLLIGRPICPTDAIANNLPYAIASASVSGFVVLTAVLVTVLCCRIRKIRMLAALKGHSVRLGIIGHPNINAEPCSEYEATAGTQGFSSDYIPREPSTCAQLSSYLHHPFKFQINGIEGILETDGGSASLPMQSSSIDGATSQVDQLDRGVKPGHHSSARLPVVADATPSFSDTRSQATLVVINARNVQLGSGNTMIINSNPGYAPDSLVETDFCSESLTFECCGIGSDELDVQAPASYHLELDEDYDSAVEAEYCTSSLASKGCHVAYEESGTQSPTNSHRKPDEDCDWSLQRASSDQPAHVFAAALPAIS